MLILVISIHAQKKKLHHVNHRKTSFPTQWISEVSLVRSCLLKPINGWWTLFERIYSVVFFFSRYTRIKNTLCHGMCEKKEVKFNRKSECVRVQTIDVLNTAIFGNFFFGFYRNWYENVFIRSMQIRTCITNSIKLSLYSEVCSSSEYVVRFWSNKNLQHIWITSIT